MNRNYSELHLLWTEVDVISNIINSSAVHAHKLLLMISTKKREIKFGKESSTRKITSILMIQKWFWNYIRFVGEAKSFPKQIVDFSSKKWWYKGFFYYFLKWLAYTSFCMFFSKYLRTGSIFYHRIGSEKDLSSFRSLNPGWLSQKKLQSSNKHTKDRNPQKVRGVLHQLGWKIFESSNAVFVLYFFCCKHPNNCVSNCALWAFCQCMEKQWRPTWVDICIGKWYRWLCKVLPWPLCMLL